MTGAEARLRAAAHQLDGDVDLLDSYQRFLALEQAYAERTMHDEGVASLSAAAAAVEAHSVGESAARAGDDDTARLHLDLAHRLGLPGLTRPGGRENWEGVDLDTVADAAAAGDRAAVAALLTRLRPLVGRYCRARLQTVPLSGPVVDPDDLVHTVLMAVLARLPERRSTSVTGFALAIARQAVRAGGRQTAMPPGLDAGLHELDAGLRELPLDERNVVVARVVIGRSAAETADLLGMTPGDVRIAQHRALARLRMLLSDPGTPSGTPSEP
ncbi:hypothetical protein GCM10017691_16630 [Pseudonocardia petroleophila]|uniref:RNA polymerase sigma factor 70 region 4 type 2 domain-containing protein n=1 Tax=Pseudonocardia petroleophila TaxID=37331 RepID=A0A7G7MHK8_9PSEU|nr:sigma factor-like helix-turn-helix DNA-binding protein [Pseudonocardia petroleophila]QNG52269.1 hypothetical protein H6H00_30245 [Pseudonocardia petroleophila]